jgi:MoaA/NifB/PqqE/SkfB family radical SAM enzyme
VLKKIPKKIEATLVTNGYRLSRGVTDKLIACGLDRIYISIQAADEGLYRTLMPGLKLNVVVNNVRYLVRCAPPDLTAIVTTTLHELNREHKEKLACLTASLGIRGFSVNNIHTRGGNLDDPRFIKKRVLNRAKRCRIFEEVNFISWDGRILPCCHDLEGITVADITRNSFNDIAAIKRDVIKKGRKYALCAYCNDEHRIRLFREYENRKSYVDI